MFHIEEEDYLLPKTLKHRNNTPEKQTDSHKIKNILSLYKNVIYLFFCTVEFPLG